MSVISGDESAPKQEKKARTPRAPRPRRTGHGKIKPPNNVSPGWIHNLLAGLTLRTLQDRDIDPGEIDDDLVRLIPGAENAPEPAELLARVYAHIMWRVPGVRVIAKRLEGTDTKSGVWSDIFALAISLWLRNRDLFAAFRETQRRKIDDERGAREVGAIFNLRNLRTREKHVPETPGQNPGERSDA